MNNIGSNHYDYVIESDKGIKNYFIDLWHYRELFFFLAWKDILVRYKQTVIGFAWSIVKPLFTTLIFSIIFGALAKLPSRGAPYPILVFAALLPWHFFAGSMTESSNSLINNANMLTKVYFPRLIMPISAVIVAMVDFIISLLILIILMIWYQFIPGWRILAIPVFLALAFMASVGIGLWLSALYVKYRDFRFIIPVILQFGLYVSPVGFTSDIVPEKWRIIYSLNPMVGIIDGFRWAIIGGDFHINCLGFIVSSIVAIFMFLFGLRYFLYMERNFADII